MTQTKPIPVGSLSLDLGNYRTVKQRSEARAVQALIAIEPDYFWALTESLLEDGYLATENILILDSGDSRLTVKEGNRRIAALKLINGLIPTKGLDVPKHIQQKIDGLTTEWKQENANVPCTIYSLKDAAKVDRIVNLAHGKGEKAGRVKWNAVARARHNRDFNGNSESGLDLLEKYLKQGENITAQQKELWAGQYPLTVLDETIWRIADRFDTNNPAELAKKYPNIIHSEILEQILNDIGNGIIKFTSIRKKDQDFGERYGLQAKSAMPSAASADPSSSDPSQRSTETQPTPTAPEVNGNTSNSSTSPAAETNSQPATTPTTQPGSGKVVAVSITDPKAITQALIKFIPLGNGRQKLALLRNEAIKLNIKNTPLAFCFLLRSMFEISAKAYCDDHATDPNGPKYLKSDNQTERKLAEVLRDVHKYMTHPADVMDKNITKALHGAITELTTPESLLSVTSMNQLIHSPVYTLGHNHICITFSNIYPFLVAMNS